MNEPTKSETFDYAINVRQVAERYGVTSTTVYKWIADKHLPFLRLPGAIEDVSTARSGAAPTDAGS
jgi:excisionase family DNA binding protein